MKLNGIVDNKLIVQAWEYGKSFADIDLEIDRVSGDIVEKHAEIVDVIQEGATPDPEVSAILAKYKEIVGPKLNEVMGYAAIPMTGGYPIKGNIGDNVIGNLIADGMNYEMKSDFALMNGGGIRDILAQGEITWENLFNIQPFNNTLVTVTIPGSALEPILNAQISSYGPDVSISGFSYTWDSATRKVVNIYLPDGTPIDKNGTYTLTVNNYMYEHGTDQYKIRQYGNDAVQGPEDLQATVNFVKSFNGPIHYVAEGRISGDIKAPELADAVLHEADLRDGSYLHEVKVSLEATDAGIGVSRIEYSLDHGVTWKRYDEGLTIIKEGKNSIQYRAIDKVHNVSGDKTLEVFITPASVESAISLVKQAEGNKGIKTSLISQLENAIKTFEKGKKIKLINL